MKNNMAIAEFDDTVSLAIRGKQLLVNDKVKYTNINQDVKRILDDKQFAKLIVDEIKGDIKRLGLSAAAAIHGFTHIEFLVYESC